MPKFTHISFVLGGVLALGLTSFIHSNKKDEAWWSTKQSVSWEESVESVGTRDSFSYSFMISGLVQGWVSRTPIRMCTLSCGAAKTENHLPWWWLTSRPCPRSSPLPWRTWASMISSHPYMESFSGKAIDFGVSFMGVLDQLDEYTE